MATIPKKSELREKKERFVLRYNEVGRESGAVNLIRLFQLRQEEQDGDVNQTCTSLKTK